MHFGRNARFVEGVNEGFVHQDVRPARLVLEVFDLGANDEQIEFPILYSISRDGEAKKSLDDESTSLKPLFEQVLGDAPRYRATVETSHGTFTAPLHDVPPTGTVVETQGTNLFTLTDYSGYDPEATGIVYNSSEDALLRGVDAGQIYPNQRTVTLGIDLSF